MTATLTESPSVGALVGDLKPALDRAGAKAPKASTTAKAWRFVSKQVVTGLDRDLEEGLIDRLAEGWGKAEALAVHAADSVKHDDYTVALASHTFEMKHDPGFDLTINGVDAGRLPVKLALEVEVGGAVLTLNDGAITEVELGKISLSGSVEVAEIATPLDLATPEFILLGKHKLKQPVRIGPAL